MPYNRSTTQVNSASSSMVGEAYLEFLSGDSGIRFGYLSLVDGVYVKENVLASREVVELRVDNTQGINDFNVPDYASVTFTDDDGTITCNLPATIVAAGTTKSWFVDSNGVVYDDISLTIPATPGSAITNMQTSVDEIEQKDSFIDSIATTVDYIDINPLTEIRVEDGVIPGDAYAKGTFEFWDKSRALDDVDIITPFIMSEYLDIIESVGLEAHFFIDESVGVVEDIDVSVEVFIADRLRALDLLNLGISIRVTDGVGVTEDYDINTNLFEISQGAGVDDRMVVPPDIDYKSLIVIDKLDFGIRGFKLIEYIEIDADVFDGTEVNVLFNVGGVWREVGYRRVNKFGAVRIGVAGNEFKIMIRNVSKTFLINNVRVGYALIDKRFARGYEYGKGN